MKNNIKIEFSPTDYAPIEFNNETHPRIKVRPKYFELGFSSVSTIFGRAVVLHRLFKVLDVLPKKYGLLIWDIYRPREVQTKLFEWMRGEIRKLHPHLNDADNYREASKYMSAPSKVGDLIVPPHLSGGAIDLTLYDTANETELNMGTEFDDCTEMAHRDYFNLQSNLTPSALLIQERRNLLRKLMEEAGFTSYQYEWWHFDIGDIFWSKIMQVPAVFGPLFDNEEWPAFLNARA